MNKVLQLSTYLIIAILFTACGSSDDECTSEAWVGAWSGTTNCADTSIDFTFNISAVDEDTIRIEYEGESEEVDINGCSINYDLDIDFLGTPIDFSFAMNLNGDSIDLDFTFSALGISDSCTTTLTR